LVKQYVKDGQRYATACNKAFKHFDIEAIKLSNDILGLSYIKEILKHNYQIKPLTIQRTNDYLSIEVTDDIASATAIRHYLINNKDITKLTPIAQGLIQNQTELVYLHDYFEMLKYQLAIKSPEQLQKIKGFDEGLEFLFKKYINKVENMDKFVELVSSKRYPKTRIQRTIIYLICNIRKDDLNLEVDYLRILGMNLKGQQYLASQKEKTAYKIITNFAKHKSPALDLEHKITQVYSLVKPELNYLYEKEYQQAVIIRKSND
jgi:predicted nucleotidyltransferase